MMEARLDAQHEIVMRDGSLDNEDRVKVMQSEFKVSQFYFGAFSTVVLKIRVNA